LPFTWKCGRVQCPAQGRPGAECTHLRDSRLPTCRAQHSRSIPAVEVAEAGDRLVQRVRHARHCSVVPTGYANFPVQPAIAKYGKVKNPTDNHHGIVGYLDEPDVAKHILDWLVPD
jgi:hypothetical protein